MTSLTGKKIIILQVCNISRYSVELKERNDQMFNNDTNGRLQIACPAITADIIDNIGLITGPYAMRYWRTRR